MRKAWAGLLLAGVVFAAGGSSTYTTTVTTKKNTLTAWYAVARKAAVKGCASGDYKKAKITVKHGITRAGYSFSCAELAATSTT